LGRKEEKRESTHSMGRKEQKRESTHSMGKKEQKRESAHSMGRKEQKRESTQWGLCNVDCCSEIYMHKNSHKKMRAL